MEHGIANSPTKTTKKMKSALWLKRKHLKVHLTSSPLVSPKTYRCHNQGVKDDSTLMSLDESEHMSLDDQSDEKHVTFAPQESLEKVRYLHTNLHAQQDWHSPLDYQRIHTNAKVAVMNARKKGFSSVLDFGVGLHERPRVQERLDTWTSVCGEVRGLEMMLSRRQARQRQRDKIYHVKHIVTVQALLCRFPNLDSAEELRRVAESSSQKAVVFAQMMGNADATVVAKCYGES
jgi:hypothetical protein